MESKKDCDPGAMLDVLYGEADALTERNLRSHQEGCASCRAEFAALRGVRRSLGAWTLPARLQPRLERRPAWRPLLAAAAGLLLALGASLGLSGSELGFRNGTLAFRLGRGQDLERLLAAQEDRHRREMEELRAALLHPAAQPVGSDREEVLRAVRRLVDDSQRRQSRVLETRLADFQQQAEAQRRYDLAQVGASLSYLEGKTGLEMAKTTELMGHVIQASQKR
ncbi:MAG TPA: hypothetical protein VJU18_07145 [Vicinamibacteria bacterium]|nr:hypothetical protein [Vicinamibacteria bacterium]